MSDPNRSLDEVPGLLEERRRYEAWLEALDARRDSTPAHVFERVQADYRGRLANVAERLASHRQAIEEERASIQSRVSLLEAEEQTRRDERSELDLRAHVGELEGADAASAFGAVDESIEQLVAEKNGLQHRIDALDALLSERPASVAAAQPEAQDVDARPVAETSAAPTADAPATDAPEGPAPTEVRSETRSDATAPERPSTPGGSFDELAFLDAVVGKDSAGVAKPGSAPAHHATYERIIQRDEADSESLLAGLAGAGRSGSNDAPLAANVPANTPIVLRPSGSIEQSKTLKCNECGAMNYPTEWYCERCGAELAAL